MKQQLRAIQALNLDPFAQDMSDFPDPEDVDPANRSAEPSILPPLSETESGSEGQRRNDRWSKVEQTILNGTTLRDKFLRAFQEDFVPFDPSSSSSTPALRPTDIDATTLPSSHLDQGAAGILERNQLIQSWTRRHRARVLRMEGDPELGLNQSQTRAIAMMLSERLSLVQGVSGSVLGEESTLMLGLASGDCWSTPFECFSNLLTRHKGKTRVIIETIKLLKIRWEVPFPILVCAHTNVAVDNLLEGLRAHGVKAIRVGPSQRVRPSLQQYTFDAALEEHPLFQEVEELKRELEGLFRRDGDSQGESPQDDVEKTES